MYILTYIYTHIYIYMYIYMYMYTYSSCNVTPHGLYCGAERVCCSILPCVAVCCSVLQYVAVRCSVLQRVAVCCSVLQCLTINALRVIFLAPPLSFADSLSLSVSLSVLALSLFARAPLRACLSFSFFLSV